MSFGHDPIFQWLAQYAYQPQLVYLAIVGMMLASGFGFPLPEEVTIMSVGLLAYMGANPELFPPPFPGAPVVNAFEAAAVTSIAVLSADLLVFSIGRVFGRKIVKRPLFQRFFSGYVMERINTFIKRYGIYATFIFRFTPGIRFPAHIFLGMTTFPAWQFLFVDSFAVVLSVPTQVLLLYYFGEPILERIHKFKVIFGIALLLLVVYLVGKKLYSLFIAKKNNGPQTAID